MKDLNSITNASDSNESVTTRLQNGVRIVEREMHRVIRLVGSRYLADGPKPLPLLVVVEDEIHPSRLITLERKNIAGLDALIRGALRSPIVSK